MSTKDGFRCCNQPHGNSPLWDGPAFSRRQFFRLAGTGLSGYCLGRIGRPLEVLAAGNAAVQRTARSAIFVFLQGAASHVDTFDLKEGSWLPSDFAPTSYGSVRFPQGLMPNLAELLDRMTIVRSVQAWAAVHSLAQIWTQIARNPTAALGKIAPNIGAVVALELEKEGGKLPGFVALNASPVGAGYLPSQYSPFSVVPSSGGLAASAHPDGQARFDTRFQLLSAMDSGLREDSPLGRDAEDMAVFYGQARGLMYDAQVDATFKFSDEERRRYGLYPQGNGPDANNLYGVSSQTDAFLVARNLVRSDLGTRYIQINIGGWDHHSNIYAANGGIYTRARTLDAGLSALIRDLEAAPGVGPGKSLLDETLIVVMGEFGRTVGNVNNQAGRDHYLQQFAVFAGGGAARGRVVGSTNATGAYTEDPGWERNRPVRPEDVAATIYSALGIDWTTVRYDDPFKRGFEYVPFSASGDVYGPVGAVFA